MRISRREAVARRRHNEERLERTLGLFRTFGLDPVVLSSSEPAEVLGAFLTWAEQRLWDRRRGA